MTDDDKATKAGSKKQDEVLNNRLYALLDKLDLVGIPESSDKSDAVGVIESTTLEVTKQAKRMIAAVGGLTVVAGGFSSSYAAVKNDTALAVAIAAGIAVVLVSLVYGLAKVVDGDVRGRAAVTADQVEARGIVATKYLELAMREKAGSTSGSLAEAGSALEKDLRVALAAYGNGVEITTESGSSLVQGLQWSSKQGLRVRLHSGDVVDMSEVTSFKTVVSGLP
jgi:hypothetical protein